MVITDIRFSFIQIETFTDTLAALSTPSIPYKFLLNDALYQAEIANIKAGGGPRRTPWHDGFGKLFWFYYMEKKGGVYVTPKDAWRALVPLQSDLGGTVSAEWVPGTVNVQGYLHPWGIGVIADVHAQGTWTLDQAVEFAFKVRRGNKYGWTADGATKQASLNALMDGAIAQIRAQAYGPTFAAGQTGEIFSVVTVLDADGTDATKAVESKETLHRMLEAFTDWSDYWKITELEDLATSKIKIKKSKSPPGHVLYGGRRGRTVWFPAAFKSAAAPHPELSCYHQNLVAATFQTESLCRLTQAAAKQLDAGKILGQFSVTYGNCIKLAAGILGRLYGGSRETTYRSDSLRDQIARTYLTTVNSVRGAVKMPALG